MIYVTGDTHGDFRRFTKERRKSLPFKLTKKDYVIVCGDFGLCWTRDEEFTYDCEWFSKMPFTLLWVQGNHENYNMIAEYPIEEWNGGKVRHIVRDKIILLERGQVFKIDGKKIFTFGGGYPPPYLVFRIPATARSNAALWAGLASWPKLTRTVPVSSVPALSWARGAQWSPARTAIPARASC